MSEMIALSGLTRWFGPLCAVDGISLSVNKGEVLGFLGPNGAGKTTTMRMAAGYLEPSAGRAVIAGHDVATQPLAAKAALGYLPEGAPAYGDMTPEGFLKFVAGVRGLKGEAANTAIARAIARTDLAEVLGRPIDTLSKGFRRRVGLAQAILHDPPVLILDEPTDGLDPNQKHEVRRLIADMAAEKAIIVSTHILEEVEAVCSRAVIIARGRLLADGTAEELLARLPHHNAIRLGLASEDSEPARAALADLPGGGAVEVPAEGDGLRVLPGTAPPGDVMAAVMAALGTAGIRPREVYVERGRLDDVFRRITADPADAA
ncbi:ABC transporter ATP-binding protein [Roseospirillum parvum]|uniref:ABC-2 type transport system ATP-binding protein n=1 Tax=Roseospirillum parvum TaxID=83401 RepID=A0A1G8B923_9PROT|nr:ABC transporter ATP-binding protein [Roseospirillum parvum]SDH29523.1 ABC-2 type transport system ATP-binding protein [Roseospirillum parvum]